MDINEVRRRLARDLSDRFPNPTRAQQEVIDAALRSLQSINRTDATPQITWMDTSFMGTRFDAYQDDRRSYRRRQDSRPTTADDILDWMRRNGWRPGLQDER